MKPERVEQLMSRNVATCREHDSLNVPAQIMWERDCGIVPVTVPEEAGERVVGVVTDRDACMGAYTQGRPLMEVPVSIAMSRVVHTCTPDQSVKDALKQMAAARVRRLPVVDDAGHLVGLLSLSDVMREEARSQKVVSSDEFAKTVGTIASPRAHQVMVAA